MSCVYPCGSQCYRAVVGPTLGPWRPSSLCRPGPDAHRRIRGAGCRRWRPDPRDSRREERQHLFSYRESLPEARNHGQSASRVSRPPTPAPPIFITHRNQQAEHPATRETAHLHGIALDPGGAGVVAAGLVDGGEGVLGNSPAVRQGFPGRYALGSDAHNSETSNGMHSEQRFRKASSVARRTSSTLRSIRRSMYDR